MYCTILGTGLSETVCEVVALIRIRGERGVFTVWPEEVRQKTGYCSGRARLGISSSLEVTDTNEPIRKKHKKTT